MKRLIKFICVASVLLICLLSIVGCGSDESNGRTEITTEAQAINAVQNYMNGTSFSLEQKIAGELGYKNFYSPDYATESATQNGDGSWNVTIKGNMSGYVDEYNDDLESHRFEVCATVSIEGRVNNIYVKER